MTDTFTDAYIECLLWADCGPDSECSKASLSDFASETIEQIKTDCKAFQARAGELLANIDPGQAGHDFWLTRNHHGAGFWDRGLGELGDQLTEISQDFSEVSPYQGDDGKVYLG
jgi:hypothetical protein